MSRQKKKKFAENTDRENIIEPGKPLYETIKGNWNRDFFKNSNAICLELACGRGEYSIGLARRNPHQNYIGIDLKGDRIWRGSGIAIEEQLTNVGFLRIQIQNLMDFFNKDEVNEIWIVFPDPRPKDREEKHRLTHNRYLDIYRELLAPNSWIRLKTDNTDFYHYTLEVLRQRTDIKDLKHTGDLYSSELEDECCNITTRYEQIFHTEENKIKYLRFRFV